MKTKIEMKDELKTLVSEKVQNTRARLALKSIPFVTRTAEQHSEMLRCWWTNSDLKEQIRHLGLAYAFVRGRRYWETERYTENGPSAVAIAAYADALAEDVQAWLEAQPTSEELSAYAEHLRLSKERAMAARSKARSAA